MNVAQIVGPVEMSTVANEEALVRKNAKETEIRIAGVTEIVTVDANENHLLAVPRREQTIPLVRPVLRIEQMIPVGNEHAILEREM